MQYNYPLKVKAERVWRLYAGGRELDRIEGKPNPADGNMPEMWILSTVRSAVSGREGIEEGICYLEDADPPLSLRDLIEKYPVQMLGEKHVAAYGENTGVLIKLLDPCIRLPMQVHPGREKAQALFSSKFGKTECWYILRMREDIPEPACIYLGFKEGVSREEWEAAFNRDDTGKMLDMLHRIEVKPGETYIVHGGVPHAAGMGILYLEIQEATDLTIRVERKMGPGIEIEGNNIHQGIGFERMFDCFDYDGKGLAEVLREWRLDPVTVKKTAGHTTESLLGYDVTPCFKTERTLLNGTLDLPATETFYGIYVRSGKGKISAGSREIPLSPNDQVFVPASCAPFSITRAGDGPLEFFSIYGPQPEA